MDESKKRYEDRFGEIGRKFGRCLDSIRSGLSDEKSSPTQKTDAQRCGKQNSTDTEKLIAFFQKKIQNAEISGELIENIELETIMSWVNELPTTILSVRRTLPTFRGKTVTSILW